MILTITNAFHRGRGNVLRRERVREGGERRYQARSAAGYPDDGQSQRLASREGRFDYLLVGSTGVSEPLPAADDRQGVAAQGSRMDVELHVEAATFYERV